MEKAKHNLDNMNKQNLFIIKYVFSWYSVILAIVWFTGA